MIDACMNCRWWKPVDEELSQHLGTCHGAPPRCPESSSSGNAWAWPITYQSDFCPRYRKGPLPVNSQDEQQAGAGEDGSGA